MFMFTNKPNVLRGILYDLQASQHIRKIVKGSHNHIFFVTLFEETGG